MPISDYEELLQKSEMLDDIRAFDQAISHDQELIPAEIVYRLLNENKIKIKIKVWREFRQLTQTELAQRCELAQATIAQIEDGKCIGSVEVLKKIAVALTVDLDDLV